MTPKTILPETQPTLRIMPMSGDINPRGDIFGGWLMAQIDIAGAIMACEKAKGPVATVSIKELLFQSPLFFGDIVSFYATIIKTGTTSVTVDIQVYAQRKIEDFSTLILKVSTTTLVYAAVSTPGQSRIIQDSRR